MVPFLSWLRLQPSRLLEKASHGEESQRQGGREGGRNKEEAGTPVGRGGGQAAEFACQQAISQNARIRPLGKAVICFPSRPKVTRSMKLNPKCL